MSIVLAGEVGLEPTNSYERLLQRQVWLPFHHSPIDLARVVGIEPTATGFKAQSNVHVIPQYSGVAYGNRTRLICLKGRGSHQKSNAINRFHAVHRVATFMQYSRSCGVAWGNRTPARRRHLERVMTVTSSQHATCSSIKSRHASRLCLTRFASIRKIFQPKDVRNTSLRRSISIT